LFSRRVRSINATKTPLGAAKATTICAHVGTSHPPVSDVLNVPTLTLSGINDFPLLLFDRLIVKHLLPLLKTEPDTPHMAFETHRSTLRNHIKREHPTAFRAI
jgi:hypothetical protein